jgi:hypothetical protein
MQDTSLSYMMKTVDDAWNNLLHVKQKHISFIFTLVYELTQTNHLQLVWMWSSSSSFWLLLFINITLICRLL